MEARLREISAIGIFSALAFAGGYILLAVPNVEIFTAIVFLSGLLFGSKNGALVGVISQALFSTLNPYGISPLPLFVAQVANRALVGFVGGKFRRVDFEALRFWRGVLYFGVTGLLLTLLFDLTTDFSSFFQAGFSIKQMKLTFTLGLPFYLVHGVVNLLIFALALPVVARGLLRNHVFRKANENVA